MNDDIIGNCWHCGADLGKADYGRETNCLSCGKSTRSCRNCRLYSRGRPNDCEEPIADAVMNKERANFCEFFDPSPSPGDASGTAPAADALLKAADDLFK